MPKILLKKKTRRKQQITQSDLRWFSKTWTWRLRMENSSAWSVMLVLARQVFSRLSSAKWFTSPIRKSRNLVEKRRQKLVKNSLSCRILTSKIRMLLDLKSSLFAYAALSLTANKPLGSGTWPSETTFSLESPWTIPATFRQLSLAA